MSAIFSAIDRRWRLTARSLRRGGWPFGVGVLVDVVGQVVQILSIFVPLKVIYLVGSGSVPSYLSAVWPDGSLDQWAWLLTSVAIGLFSVSAALTKLGGRLADRAAERFVDVVAINNPDLGRKRLRALRSMVVGNFSLTTDLAICGLFLLLLACIDMLFFLVAAGGVIVSLVCLGGVVASSRRLEFFDRLWRGQFSGLVEALMLTLFVFFFVIMVALILDGYELGFLRSLIVLILTRRLFQALERAMKRHRVLMQKQGVEYLIG